MPASRRRARLILHHFPPRPPPARGPAVHGLEGRLEGQPEDGIGINPTITHMVYGAVCAFHWGTQELHRIADSLTNHYYQEPAKQFAAERARQNICSVTGEGNCRENMASASLDCSTVCCRFGSLRSRRNSRLMCGTNFSNSSWRSKSWAGDRMWRHRMDRDARRDAMSKNFKRPSEDVQHPRP